MSNEENKIKMKYLNSKIRKTNKEIRKYKLYKIIDKLWMPLEAGAIILFHANALVAIFSEQPNLKMHLSIFGAACLMAVYPMIHLYRDTFDSEYRDRRVGLNYKISELKDLKQSLSKEKKDVIVQKTLSIN